jgi:hypothetical protein
MLPSNVHYLMADFLSEVVLLPPKFEQGSKVGGPSGLETVGLQPDQRMAPIKRGFPE